MYIIVKSNTAIILYYIVGTLRQVDAVIYLVFSSHADATDSALIAAPIASAQTLLRTKGRVNCDR